MEPCIAICTAVYDTYEPLYLRGLRELIIPGKPPVFCEAYGALYESALNKMTTAALEHPDVTHLFILDADMVVAPDVLLRLLVAQRPIVGGLCFMRRPPFGPCMFSAEGQPITEWAPGAVLEVYHTGGGCLLVAREVFEGLVAHAGHWWDSDGRRSPDECFHARARAAGFKIHTDTGCHVGHVGKVVIDEDFWRRNR